MSFSYFDKDNKLQKLDIQVGASWSDCKVNNDNLNSIFREIDDGDGIVQFTEKLMVDSLLKQADNQNQETANNDILENEELNQFSIKTALSKQAFDKNDFTIEAIKTAYPEDKFTYNTINDIQTAIIDKSTGKTVLQYTVFGSEDNLSIDEYTTNGNKYKVSKGGVNYDSSISYTIDDYYTDFSYNYKDGKLVKSDASNIRDIDVILENIDNPEWIKNDAIDFLDSMRSGRLLNLIETYNKKAEGGYLLDKINSSNDIPADIKQEFMARTMRRLDDAYGYKQEMINENSHVKNEFYESKDTYTVNSSNDIITITKNSPEGSTEEPQEYTIDLNKLVSSLPLDMQPKTKAVIQSLPGEVLVDMSIECDKFSSPKDRKVGANTAGLFVPALDRISFGFHSFNEINALNIVHELGHAIDYRQKKPNSNNPSRSGEEHSIRNNKALQYEYYKAKYAYAGLSEYIKEIPETLSLQIANEQILLDKGYLTVGEDGKTTWNDKLDCEIKHAYMFSSLYEASSELYCFAMIGKSDVTPKEAVTPELMAEFLKGLEYTRTLSQEDRHLREK